MKSFALFMAELNEGQTNSALSGHLAELLQSVKLHGRAGSIKLHIKVVPATKGTGEVDKITITVDSQLALPKPQQPSDFYFLTEDAELSRQHPKQHSLDLRDVSINRDPERPYKEPANFTTPDADGVINYKDLNNG